MVVVEHLLEQLCYIYLKSVHRLVTTKMKATFYPKRWFLQTILYGVKTKHTAI